MGLGEAVQYANRQIRASALCTTDKQPADDSSVLPNVDGRALADVLTGREQQVLRLLGEGRSNKDMAQGLFLSVRTVENHLAHIYAKLGVPGRLEAALLARTVFGEAQHSSAG
jgi:DNA-binding CsgD family transcriptional regulator